MATDISEHQLIRRLEAGGIRFNAKAGAAYLLKPAEYVACFSGRIEPEYYLGYVGSWKTRRRFLAHVVELAEVRRAIWALRVAHKAAWDAEFSQPVPESPREADLRRLSQALKQYVEDDDGDTFIRAAGAEALRLAGVTL